MLRDSGRSDTASEAVYDLPEAGEGHDVHADVVAAVLSSPAGNSDHKNLADEAFIRMSEAIEGQKPIADLAVICGPSIADQLAELQVRRLFYIKSTNRQLLAAKSLVRRALGGTTQKGAKDEKLNARASRIVDAAIGGKEQKAEDAEIVAALGADLAVIGTTIEPMVKARKQIEKDMKKASKTLAVYEWAKGIRGLGELGLAVIVGEAGDLSKYPEKGHLWKRLGLAPYEGRAASTWRREGGLSAEEWTNLGYKPARRAEMYAVVADPLFRAQSVAKGPYREVYDRRRAKTAEAHADWTKAHSHADAMRVMTKHLVRDLWRAWKN